MSGSRISVFGGARDGRFRGGILLSDRPIEIEMPVISDVNRIEAAEAKRVRKAATWRDRAKR